MKQSHIPVADPEEELSPAYSRLILKGARRVFLWELAAAIETVRNQETAAAAAIPAVLNEQQSGPYEKKTVEPRVRGFDGLGPKKSDLSQYMDSLTDKQRMAFSLKWEYGLQPTEIASRMGINRKTVHEHIQAAGRKIDQFTSSGRRKARHTNQDES